MFPKPLYRFRPLYEGRAGERGQNLLTEGLDKCRRSVNYFFMGSMVLVSILNYVKDKTPSNICDVEKIDSRLQDKIFLSC